MNQCSLVFFLLTTILFPSISVGHKLSQAESVPLSSMLLSCVICPFLPEFSSLGSTLDLHGRAVEIPGLSLTPVILVSLVWVEAGLGES